MRSKANWRRLPSSSSALAWIARNLPGSWASTGNALEMLAFHAKDVLVVIDDFAPQGNAADVARYHAAADRVFRAAGNQAGRGRLDSSARLREPRPPRGLVLSTGEDIPRGHSIRARLLILELAKGMITPAVLTECQAAANAGEYSQAMSAFLQWLASRLDEVRASLERRVTELRANTRCAILLMPARRTLLRTYRRLRIVPEVRRGMRRHRQRACRTTGQCVLAGSCARRPSRRRNITRPRNPQRVSWHCFARACRRGRPTWRRVTEASRNIRSKAAAGAGTVRRRIAIPRATASVGSMEPTSTSNRRRPTRSVQMTGRDIGEGMPVSEQMLKKRLREKNLLASIDKARETITVRRTIAGSKKDVLHFLRDTLLPAERSGRRRMIVGFCGSALSGFGVGKSMHPTFA